MIHRERVRGEQKKTKRQLSMQGTSPRIAMSRGVVGWDAGGCLVGKEGEDRDGRVSAQS